LNEADPSAWSADILARFAEHSANRIDSPAVELAAAFGVCQG